MLLVRLSFIIFILISVGCGSISFKDQTPEAKPIEVRSFSLPLFPENPSSALAGRLTYLGGLHLTSPDKRFGGFSGIISVTGGKDFYAISDKGWFLLSSLSYDSYGRLSAVSSSILGRLKDMDGSPLPLHEAVSDCEGIATFPGVYAVSFEQEHRILVYPSAQGLSGVPGSIPFPPFMYGAPATLGCNAICSFPKDRLLLFLEAEPPDNCGVAALGDGTVWHKFHYRRTPGFSPSAASRSSSGYIYILEHFYNPAQGAKCRVIRIPDASIKPNARVIPEVLAVLEPPMTIDNMEGLTVFQRNGVDHLLMISDDNYSSAQRTILMLFKVGSN